MTRAVIGHAEVLNALGEEGEKLPPVSLFLGPRSVGKWTTAEYLRAVRKVLPSDVLRVSVLTMDVARSLVEFAGTSPAGPAGKLAIVRVDRGNREALNVLLKTLEEATTGTKFILIADTPVLQTIASRSVVYLFNTLTTPQVIAILTARKFSPAMAEQYAPLGRGSVQGALDAIDGSPAKPVVLAALSAFRDHDPAQLDALADKWSEEATQLLDVWAREAFTQRWMLFTAEETDLPGKALPMKILMALRANVRPRLVIRSSLMKVLRGA